MTYETLQFLQRVLNTVVVKASANDFEEISTQVVRAKKELAEEITLRELDREVSA